MPLLCMAVYNHANANNSNVADQDTCAHLDEVIVTGVTGNASIREIAAPISIVSHEALRTHQSTNIIDAISRQPGVNQITTGGGISKPVIRGLGYNRVLVVSDGIRQEGQQWGDEHGVEIDGQRVYSVEIQKGPASLMYGSDAMAGVIIMHDAPIMPIGAMYAEAGTEYQTNNGLIAYTINSRGNHDGMVWDWRWSQRWAHDYRAPEDGLVTGTRFCERALSGMLGVNRSWGHSHVKMSYYNLTPGMTEVDEGYMAGSCGYAIEAPFQQVRHYKVVIDNSFHIGENILKAIIGYQQNRRQEYEDADECGLDFRLHSVNYDIRYVSQPLHGGWKINTGINGMFQQSENLGSEYLIPAYRLFDFGVFATASRTITDNIHLSGGLRYDHRSLHSFSLYDDGEERFADFKRNFGALSGSVGIIYNVNNHLDLKANISHGFRAPNMSELGSNGEHEGTFRYELGNSGLKPEHSWQIDIGLDYSSDFFSASVAAFVNCISNYIFLSRTDFDYTDPTPEQRLAAADDIPVYHFIAGNARIMGGEARIILHLLHHLHFENTFSYVDSHLLNAEPNSRYLPFTPAPRWLSILHYDIPLHSRIVKSLFAEAETDINFSQNHIMTANGTETPTPAYTLWNLNFGTDIYLHGKIKLCSININATNILNCAYQSHLSRLKYAETLPFTGRHGINNMGRNIGFKVTFPLYL